MSALARKHDAINLGQGFPDEDGPAEILKRAAESTIEGPNQYPPVEGLPELREAIVYDQKRFYNLNIDAATETLVTSGATEALAAAFLGFLQAGDEVVLLAPFYECYAPQIEATGASIKFVSLAPPTWRLAADALEDAISKKTKIIVINTPHNPLGKVMRLDELEIVADAARRHDLIVICDEVYEHLIFDDVPHIPLMTLPEMFDRTIRIGSAGKTFSLTGYRLGHVVGPGPLIEGVKKAHQFLAYCSPPSLQKAVALGFRLGDEYYAAFRQQMQAKRDRMTQGLNAAGFNVLPCEGTYFITADITSVGRRDDAEFCHEITTKAKVAAVPLSAFYHPAIANAPRNYARFCFCKKPEILDEAAVRLKNYFG